jgi:hypothetical protein
MAAFESFVCSSDRIEDRHIEHCRYWHACSAMALTAPAGRVPAPLPQGPGAGAGAGAPAGEENKQDDRGIITALKDGAGRFFGGIRDAFRGGRQLKPCPEGFDCAELHRNPKGEHVTQRSHPCRFEASCRDMNDPEHVRRFLHQDRADCTKDPCSQLEDPEHRARCGSGSHRQNVDRVAAQVPPQRPARLHDPVPEPVSLQRHNASAPDHLLAPRRGAPAPSARFVAPYQIRSHACSY